MSKPRFENCGFKTKPHSILWRGGGENVENQLDIKMFKANIKGLSNIGHW